MMRCPKHGPRADSEFKRIAVNVPPAKGQGLPLEVWKHQKLCGEFVWVVTKREPVRVQ